MGTTEGVIARVRRPEYTGENRCMPCTAVNVVIAVAASLALFVLAWAAGAAALGTAAGVGFLGLAGASIYLRGYLVPGTPTLTKRYMPDWMLAWFGKAPESPAEPDSDLDAEAVLTGVGALEECPDRPDLCLTDGFRTEWHAAIDAVEAGEAARERLLDLIEVDDGDLEVQEFGQAFRATLDGQPVGTWQSEAAFLADLGAAEVLAERDDAWRERAIADRGRLLNGLRLFLDTCPACGGVPDFGTETVESCCSTHEVAAVECSDCGARLFETRT